MMKDNDEVTIDHNLGMSRRAILKAASAVAAAGLAAGLPEAAVATAGPTDYGPGNNLGPTNIYPLLAAWLILTTNGDAHGDFPIPGSMGSAAGLGQNTYNYIYNTFYNDPAYQSAFASVRGAFQQVAQHFAKTPAPNSPNPYGAGICPDKKCVIQTIASLTTVCK
jgi:hypothetical protein